MRNTARTLPFLFLFSITTTTFAAPASAQVQSSASLRLSDIKGLNKKINIPPGEFGYNKLLQILRKSTALEIDTRDPELRQATAYISCPDASASSVMDAMTILFKCEWRKEGNAFYLVQGKDYIEEIFKPASEQDKERLAIGLEFFKQFESLPRNQQNQLLSSGIPVAELPLAMQSSFQRMYEKTVAQNDPTGEKGLAENLNYLPQITLSLKKQDYKDAPSVKGLFVSYNVPNGARGGWRIHNYDAVKGQSSLAALPQGDVPAVPLRGIPVAAVPLAQDDQDLSDTGDPKITAEWKQVVLLQAKDAKAWQVIRQLSQEYIVPFICDPRASFQQRVSIQAQKLSLWSTLDTLTTSYKDTQWIGRKSGFIVLRSPVSSARDAKQGSVVGETKQVP